MSVEASETTRMAFRIERSSRDGPPKARRSLPGRLQVIVGCSGPRHADSKAGTPRNPGCCKRRLANGCRARPWTDWPPPLPRPYAGIESEFYPSGRPPRRGSVGDSSRRQSPRPCWGSRTAGPTSSQGRRPSLQPCLWWYHFVSPLILYSARSVISLSTPCRFGKLVLREFLRRNSSARHLVMT